MSVSTADSMRALRAADPAIGVDVATLCPDWESILAELTIDDAATEPRRAGPARPARQRRLPTPRWRLTFIAAAVAVAAIVAGAVNWPWSEHGPTAVAYGVTKRSDGSVAVRVSLTHPLRAPELQSRLRAAGVSALVLVESAPGTCTEPAPTTVPSTGQIISLPDNIAHGEGFVITPTGIPAGAVLVIAFPPVAALPAGTSAIAGLWVTREPPSCIASVVTGSASAPSVSTDGSPTK
jgi:hypothetical protein